MRLARTGPRCSNQPMESMQWGPLQGVVTDSSVRDGAESAQAEQVAILLHGWGAPGTDLVGLAAHLSPSIRTRFVFLQSPRTVDGTDGPSSGRAWWPLDMMELQVKRMLQQYDDLAQMEPEGLDRARDELSGAIAAIQNAYPGLPLYVGGFSQGSMLAMDWVLTAQAEVAGLMVLSGTTLREATWRQAACARKQRVFQSHSPDDQVLPLALAERFRSIVVDAGWEHSWVTFSGGHGIGPGVLAELESFLSARREA